MPAAARRVSSSQAVTAQAAPAAPDVDAAIALLNEHYRAFEGARAFAERTGHSVPSDTKSWSEVLVGLLTGIPGRGRRKGSDLDDGSDVKAANVWCAIDTPRFNGCAPAGRSSMTAMRAPDLSAFDDVPFLFLVLWDQRPPGGAPRCRVWVVRPRRDPEVRRVVAAWYVKRAAGETKSDNFQLQPPRNRNDNVIRNDCGSLAFPLFFAAELDAGGYRVVRLSRNAQTRGLCRSAD